MFLDLHTKEGAAAIDDDGGEISYARLREFCREFSEKIGHRTLVFILSENNIGSLAAYVASLSSKIVPLIIGADTDAKLLQNLFQTYRPEFTWSPHGVVPNVELQPVFSSFGYTLFRTEYATPALHPDLALLLSTSGSTGSPKLVRHSYQNVEANAKNVATFFELTPAERPIAMLPLQYTMGLSTVTSHLYAGATVLLMKKSLTDALFWKFTKEHRATSFTGVPYSFDVLEKLRFFRMDLPHLTLLTQGGGKLKDELFRKCAEYAAQQNKRFIATYGQTEGTARMAYLPAELALQKTGSIGRAIPQGELSLVDENGHEISQPEATGQLVYRGPNVTLGYATEGAHLANGDERNGILFTGDIARRDSDGCYYIVGRTSRFLKLYGLRVGLDEIEAIIRNTFDADCVCQGTDEKLIISIIDPLLAEPIKKQIVETTGLFHQAIEVRVVDLIERNSSGKVIYRNADR